MTQATVHDMAEAVLAPNSVEAEEAVLGSILLDPSSLFDVPFLDPDDFFIVRNSWIFRAMRALSDRGDEIDNITLVEELRSRGDIDEIGGPAYITYLLTHTPSSIYTETYGRIVERAAIRRRGLDAASAIAQAMHEEAPDIDTTISQASSAFFAWMAHRHGGRAASALTIAGDVLTEAEHAYALQQRGDTVGLPSGFAALDDQIGGFHKHKLYIVAGRPGMGKTALLLCVVYTLIKAGVPVGVFSLEMSSAELMRRLVAMETGISTGAIENGRLSEREFALVVEATNRLGDLPLWVNDTPGIGIAAVRSQAKAWYLEHGIKAVFLDYLQLAAGDQNLENRVLEVGSISRGLKHCARELEIPVIAAAQLNRGVESRANKRPGLADLRESGDIENDADVVAFIYREGYYNPGCEQPNMAEIIIGKQRNGPTGSIDLIWKPGQTQFCDVGQRDELDLRGYSPNAADNHVFRGGE